MNKRIKHLQEEIARLKAKLKDPDTKKYKRDMKLVKVAIKTYTTELGVLEAE